MFLSRVSELEAALARYPVKNEVKAGQHTRTPARGSLFYFLPRALSKLFLMASRKSVVFTKCSFSFTLASP